MSYDCICLYKSCSINITKSYLFPNILLGVKINYIACKHWRIWVSIPVPLACEASALPFELIPLDEDHINIVCNSHKMKKQGFGNYNREIRLRGKHPLTDKRQKVPYDCVLLRNLRILRSDNRNYLNTFLHREKELDGL